MKIFEIVNASTALRRLVNQDMPLKTAYWLTRLVDKLNTHLSYFDQNMERIQKLADNKDSELDALLQEEVEVDFKKVTIVLDDRIRISTSDILTLRDNFIDFVDPDGEEGS